MINHDDNDEIPMAIPHDFLDADGNIRRLATPEEDEEWRRVFAMNYDAWVLANHPGDADDQLRKMTEN